LNTHTNIYDIILGTLMTGCKGTINLIIHPIGYYFFPVTISADHQSDLGSKGKVVKFIYFRDLYHRKSVNGFFFQPHNFPIAVGTAM